MTDTESQLSASKVKELRRIPIRTEMPTDKSQLIQYLSDRIRQAEEALTDTEELLESQATEREQIAKSISHRNQQLEKLYQVDQRGLPQKIKEKLTEILTITITQKMEAESRLQEETSQNYEFKKMYQELKCDEKVTTRKIAEQTTKEEGLTRSINRLNEQNGEEESELKILEDELRAVKTRKQQMEDRYLQMKVALERMGDIKAVINRFFGNEDLFDDKMDLKEQHIQKIEIPQRDVNHSNAQISQRLPSRENKNQAKLKPLHTKAGNEDEDFWRGDFSKAKPNY